MKLLKLEVSCQIQVCILWALKDVSFSLLSNLTSFKSVCGKLLILFTCSPALVEISHLFCHPSPAIQKAI